MKKQEIYVVIDSEEKRLRAIQILTDAKESMSKDPEAYEIRDNYKFLRFNRSCVWYIHSFIEDNETEITLDQLEQLLNPKEIKLDALKLIAESYSFELVEKKREIKVGDFGKFFDHQENNPIMGFLKDFRIESEYPYRSNYGGIYRNFSHLTPEEKQQIQENW